MKKIAVIGGGIFGVTTALELSKNFDVYLYERSDNLLSGASTNNHLRYHYGYHYPRSKKTAAESLNAQKSFEKEYGGCISKPFPAYYAVSKNTKTTPKDFLEFCGSLNLPYKIEFPEKKFLDRSRIDLCIKVPEPVYDPEKLLSILLKKLSKSTVNLKLKHEVIGGEISATLKTLKIKHNSEVIENKFDYVINATYCDFNNFNRWFSFPQKKVLYELVELLEIKLPFEEKIGLTVIDGEFSSLLPRGDKETFTLGHVKESVLKEIISDNLDSSFSEKIKSNKENILKKGTEDFPFLKDAEIVKSIFITRVVKANVDESDERPTELTDYGNGVYSIFAGKVVTCVEVAKKLSEKLTKEFN